MKTIVAILLTGLVVAGSVFGLSDHPHFWWDRVPGFAAMLGFAGCYVIVVLSNM